MTILQRPSLKQPIYVYHDPAGRGSILLSEQREQLLDHQIFPHLLPLLDARHTLQAMTDRLKGTFAPQDILSALFTLQKQGWLAHPPTCSNDPSFVRACFSRSSPPPETMIKCVTTIQCYGGVDEATLRLALRTVKVKVVAENADLVVVFTDSYARPELQAVNDKAEQPWLLVKPVGTELWIGPLVRPVPLKPPKAGDKGQEGVISLIIFSG